MTAVELRRILRNDYIEESTNNIFLMKNTNHSEVGVPYQSVTFDVTSEWLTNGISPESPITFEC